MTISFQSTKGVLNGDFVYERAASTLAVPVKAAAQNYLLLSYAKPTTRGDLLLTALGTDQHDNSLYTWKVDGVTLPISGSARVGSIHSPFQLPIPIRVKTNVQLYVTNNNAVAYPNNGLEPSDAMPYEGVFIGQWA
ncbi:MAG TPA: hypothetical protein PLW50_00445 [Smithellaceae bacterium]|jgi:hypothetical protein|nr:hypothetical protein [Smithellaceae bacterium]